MSSKAQLRQSLRLRNRHANPQAQDAIKRKMLQSIPGITSACSVCTMISRSACTWQSAPRAVDSGDVAIAPPIKSQASKHRGNKKRKMTKSQESDILVDTRTSATDKLSRVMESSAMDAGTHSSTVMDADSSHNTGCQPSDKTLQASSKEEFTPRQYQLELLEAALDHNTIVCLQTGTGKTFIAVMLIKELAREIRQNYRTGGKRTVFLVNTVPLVSQQASVIKLHTDLSVGEYIGAMNVDLWDGRRWEGELRKHQVLVMTAQIFLDILHHGFMGLSRVNLLIFDECHHAVKGHPYREIMKLFATCPKDEHPRVLGLTASILSSKCNPVDFEKNLTNLEKTMRCTAETTADLSSMKMYGTKPKETVIECSPYTNESDVYFDLQTILQEADDFIRNCQMFIAEEAKDPRVKAKQVISDCIHVLSTIGPFGLKLFIQYSIPLVDKDLAIEYLEWPRMFLQYAKTQLRMAYKICEVAKVGESIDDWKNTDMIAPKMIMLLRVLTKFKPVNEEDGVQASNWMDSHLCGVVFVERRSTAVILDYLLKEIQKKDPDLKFVSSSVVVGANGTFGMGEELMKREFKKQEAELKKFRKHETNLLFATSVLEEGVDVPKLNLVVRYDLPKLYGSYIQSRGRARAPKSHYIMLVDSEEGANFKIDLYNFCAIEKILQIKCHNREQHDEEEINAHMTDSLIPRYMPREDDGAPMVTLTSAIPLLYRYCSKLPSDHYTQLMPRFKTFPIEDVGGLLYHSMVSLPTNCPIKEIIYGCPMERIKLSEMAAALETCIRLHQAGELDDHLLPVEHKHKVDDDEDILDDNIEEDAPMVVIGLGKPGTTKRRQLYKKMVSTHLKDNLPQANAHCHLYKIHMKAAGVCQCNQTAQKYGYHPEDIPQCFGLVTKRPIPMIPEFSVYTRTSKLIVTFDLVTSELEVTTLQLTQLKTFHQCIFAEALLMGRQNGVYFDIENAEANYLIAPLNKGSHQVGSELDWNLVRNVNKAAGSFNKLSVTPSSKRITKSSQSGFQPPLFQDVVVAPTYRSEDEPERYFVKGIDHDMTVSSLFPDDRSMMFKDYYKMQYGITIENLEQPLICVQHVPRDLNFLVAKNESSGCRASVGKSASGRKNQKQNREYLVPELCHVYSLPSSLWRKALYLPSVLHRLNHLLIADELLVEISQGLDLTQSTQPAQYPFPSLCPNNLLHQCDKVNAEYEEDVGQQFESSPSMILQALTTTRARDGFNLERLEMLGDSFLKFSSSVYLYITRPTWNEGRLSAARSKMVRNSNLYQIGKKKGIPQKMSVVMFQPKDNWLPPGFCFEGYAYDENCTQQWIADKSIADSIEALIGCFLTTRGTVYTLKFMTNWLGIRVLPANGETGCDDKYLTDEDEDCDMSGSDSEGAFYQGSDDNQSITDEEVEEGEIVEESIDLLEYFQSLPSASISSTQDAEEQLAHLTQGFKTFEENINYRFHNKAYLLQALTHSSYHYNHVTECYQRLEFLGDAILDYLITKHLYNLEDHHELSAGALTDIRSSLVCNSALAHWAVAYDFHKYLKFLSPELFYLIEKFVKRVQDDDERMSFQSDSTTSSSSEEDDEMQTEDIPKTLGDIVESVAGAIYLDSGLSLDTVWGVFYPIMKSQIEMYIANPPMSPIRQLVEMKPNKVSFSKPEISVDETTKAVRVTVEVQDVGKFVGSGKNSRVAKANAASKAIKKIQKLNMK